MKFLRSFNSISLFHKEQPLHAIYSTEEFVEILDRERERADRHNHYFSLVVFDMGPNEANRAAARRLVRTISRRVRNIDEVGWYDKWRVGVIMPYTPAEGAWEVADDICQFIGATLPPPACAVYTYPSEGLTGRKELVKSLHKKVKQ